MGCIVLADSDTFLGFFRVLGGGHVDLADSFTNHADYVSQIAYHAWGLQAGGYLLESDFDAIVLRALQFRNRQIAAAVATPIRPPGQLLNSSSRFSARD